MTLAATSSSPPRPATGVERPGGAGGQAPAGAAAPHATRPTQRLDTPAGLPAPRRAEGAPVDLGPPRAASARIDWPRSEADAQLLNATSARRFASARHPPHPHGVHSGGSPLLPHVSSGRSDHFSIEAEAGDTASMQSELFSIDNAPERSRDHVAIDIAPPPPPPPPPPPLPPREQIEQALAQLEFAAPPGPQREAQQALEARYLDWATGVAEKRQAAFGDGGYRVGEARLTAFAEAVVPALYDGARQFISSSARSPFQSATLTAIAPRFEQAGGLRVNHGELDNHYDAAVIGGAVGGFTAYAVDSTLLTAMDRRAKAANLAQLKAVDLKALVPDPGVVQLQVVDGRKAYWQPAAEPGGDIETGDGAVQGRPSLAELKDGAALQRKSLQTKQEMLEGSGWGSLAQPLLTGAVNTLRRLLMPVKSLQQVLPVFGGSMLASGSAGGLTKLGLGLAKPLASGQVDDLLGGTQRASLFATRLPDPTQEPARLSDIGALPRHAVEAAKDTVALARQFVAGPWRDTAGASRTSEAVMARVDDCARVVAANTLASVFANGSGPFAARLLRGDAPAADAGESQRSDAYLLQQATTSFGSDLAWQALKKGFKGGTLDLAGPLDRWQARQEQQAASRREASPDA